MKETYFVESLKELVVKVPDAGVNSFPFKSTTLNEKLASVFETGIWNGSNSGGQYNTHSFNRSLLNLSNLKTLYGFIVLNILFDLIFV
jgi:hypothetical protein